MNSTPLWSLFENDTAETFDGNLSGEHDFEALSPGDTVHFEVLSPGDLVYFVARVLIGMLIVGVNLLTLYCIWRHSPLTSVMNVLLANLCMADAMHALDAAMIPVYHVTRPSPHWATLCTVGTLVNGISLAANVL